MKRTMIIHALIGAPSLAAVALLVVGCGVDESGSDLNGIYRVDTWTLNTASCDAEGASIKDQSEPSFFVKYENAVDLAALNVRPCREQCQADFSDDDTFHHGRPSLREGNDEDGWTRQSADVSFSNGMCTGSLVNERLVSQGTDAVRIELRKTAIAPFAAAGLGDGECFEERPSPDHGVLAATRAAAAGMPCTRLEVFTGSLLER